MSVPLHVVDLGLMEYEKAWDLQREWVSRKKAARSSEDVLLVVEHPAVYTIGRKLADETFSHLESVFTVERGGEATFHNPGQLVAYPILELRDKERDVHRYLRNLEEVLIQQIRLYGLAGERREGATGVWLVGQNKKIASMGIAVTGWVTYHGIALNVENDLSGFGEIQPCGFSAGVMTSIREQTKRGPTLDEAKRDFVATFRRVFERDVVAT